MHEEERNDMYKGGKSGEKRLILPTNDRKSRFVMEDWIMR